MKFSLSQTLSSAFITLAVVGIVMAQLFPAVTSVLSPGSPEAAQALGDISQIATAVGAFETEYGLPPGTKTGAVGGEMLAALMGNNPKLNPRGLVFLEVNKAAKGKSGVQDGYFIDPWGGKYQIAFAHGTNNWVNADTNRIVVRKMVAVWSDPSLGTDAASVAEGKKNLRHLTSWE